MYKTKQDFLELLSGLSDMEQQNLGEAINELNYEVSDQRVVEMADEITDLESKIEELKGTILEQDIAFDKVKELLP